jgi:Protein of unknown function (DUF2892)
MSAPDTTMQANTPQPGLTREQRARALGECPAPGHCVLRAEHVHKSYLGVVQSRWRAPSAHCCAVPSAAEPHPETVTPSKEDTMKRPEINITPSERAGRIALGAAAAVAGLVLLLSASGVLAVVLLALLVLAGLDLVVTGALGHCPLYTKLGHVPRSLRRAT